MAEVEPDEDEPGGRDPTPDRDDVEALHAEVETLRQETRRLQKEVEHQKERFKDLWRANCQSLTKQEEKESASTFIRRLERTFQVAYGHDRMLSETRNTLLHGQLQEGLLHELMRAPAVSGAQSCASLLATRRKGWLNCAGGSSTNGLRVPPSPRVRPGSHSNPRMVRQRALGRGSPVSQGSVSRAKRQDMGIRTALRSALLEDSRRIHARPRSRSPPSLRRVVIQSTTPCLVSSTLLTMRRQA